MAYSCFCLFLSGPQTTIHYQRKVVSIFPFIFVIKVYIWLILQQFDVDVQSQMTVKSGPVMTRSLSPLPLKLRIHWLQCKSLLAWICVAELFSFKFVVPIDTEITHTHRSLISHFMQSVIFFLKINALSCQCLPLQGAQQDALNARHG